jgi:uncharacterized protein (DUF1330 family)
MNSLTQKIDKQLVKELGKKNLPTPLDALNLITFDDEKSYRLYGLLASPLVLLLGGRPVWIGRYEKSVYGKKLADEIVIIRYPSHRVLLKIVCSKYYNIVNYWREKGGKLEFSLTKQIYGKLKPKGLCLVIHYNLRNENIDTTLKKLKTIIEENNGRLYYASYETSTLNIFKSMIPSSPNPAQYKQTAIFSYMSNRSLDIINDNELINKIQSIVHGFSIQVYRTLTTKESMPWSKTKAR